MSTKITIKGILSHNFLDFFLSLLPIYLPLFNSYLASSQIIPYEAFVSSHITIKIIIVHTSTYPDTLCAYIRFSLVYIQDEQLLRQSQIDNHMYLIQTEIVLHTLQIPEHHLLSHPKSYRSVLDDVPKFRRSAYSHHKKVSREKE